MLLVTFRFIFFFFKQKTSYEMRISDWSSDVCSSDLGDVAGQPVAQEALELADLEEEVLRLAQLRRGATDHRVGRLELGRRIRCAAVLAVVAVLVRRAAVGADALDVAVGQIGRASWRERVWQSV